MSYNAKGNRPFEWASKSQHSHVINDPYVQSLMKRCKFPSTNHEAENDVRKFAFDVDTGSHRDVTTIIAVDGGYTEVTVRKNYPSSKIAFFQFGGLEFSLNDLKELGESPFIHPEKMEKFKKLERFKLAIPTKATSLDSLSMIDSVRIPLIEFLNENRNGKKYIDTLKWLVFHDFKNKGVDHDYSLQEITFGSLPQRSNKIFKDVTICKSEIDSCGYFEYDGERFNLVDILRFHEVVDEELGASGLLGYLTNVIEHIIIVHCIKEIASRKPSFLKRFLFIKDGPLGFFGQTAKLHKDMRELCNRYISEYSLKLVGLEKSGSFVEHADQITSGENACLQKGQVLPLNNNYIYKHILPGPSTEEELSKLPPYASTSYYSGKLVYRSQTDRTWVLTIPVRDSSEVKRLNERSFSNLNEILNVVDHLKCDIYENAIVPIALVNQLVSLANHPSSRMLEKFAIQSMND